MKRQQGFTLLEILVVLSLLAVLLMLVGGAIVGASRAVAKAERYTVRLDEMRATQNFLRRAIGQALPLDFPRPGSGQRVVFLGSAQALSFIAPMSSSLGGGLQLHQVMLHGRQLQVSFAGGEPQVLLHQVRDLQLAYRGYTPTGQGTGWVSAWPWPARLPQAVRIEAQVDGAVPWVTQSVSLRLDLSSAPGAP
ncbi:prepilin-type N-terminal cleavage/methylation domain-containing protein [Pseudomonas abieticivorans]|uniref:prepilin-type N-terminal cleavage/methylation domain-containing protein n=1 Tax=Pseudomonas abieticivorans TaxID=2931382 RepID=UPI0020C01B1A|nr:prepilin-type N-terminal cleavage/methylation domain-containing protein [Pseudomonas sp. PIA16]